jgi:hypothetical protein
VLNNAWNRDVLPPANNGGNNWISQNKNNAKPASLVQKSKSPDINERNMDGKVFKFDSGMDVVPVQQNPWTRPELPYATNGGDNLY